MVDRDLTTHDAELAGRVEVISGLDMRLAHIDPAAGEDRYLVMQGLKDPTISEKDPKDAKTCYCYMRAGGTGTRGSIELNGPMEHTKVAKQIADKFQEMTGHAWNTVEPGHRPLPGKYWLQHKAVTDDNVQWQYWVDDGIDGKKTGWWAYEAAASAEVEEIYAQHIANDREDRTKSRLIQSGYFKYQVDLEKMTQQNTKSKTTRTIRRATGDAVLEAAKPALGVFGKAVKKATLAVEAKKKEAKKEVMKKAAAAGGSKGKLPPMKKKGKAPKAMKAMKKAKPMKKVKKAALKKKKKPTKAEMKLKKVPGETKKDKQRRIQRTLVAVWRGKLKRTPGGLKKDDLMKNARGKIVSKKKSAKGKEQFKRVSVWIAALVKARKELGLTGKDVPTKGSPLYKKVKELMPTVKPHPTK
mmetsp:Transcript_71475/g.149415  ORF Transcript_71475/g.149415 Transcript_71475/m.149415 type:complete len:412 (-) Transcript_71475:217-1452(-)|eukprot:CAMPEP_0206455100 /NCGR_PEP_ID=MMETSP0324_2-20121206/21547_1 /ASSEMBLY_ACC=CAM_ASM_000836 /TAXON_ID=2866 /ORGANISM="Crypthecodinium cohnii, Strain Seligo" /LENGTH=411 /DNA_ID=CAMNT_0053925731 /DNA_START=156 /DNA_END=1391 /DNA_ORIENTATION=-